MRVSFLESDVLAGSLPMRPGDVKEIQALEPEMLFVFKFSNSLIGLDFNPGPIMKGNFIDTYIDCPGGNDVC
jgi:hypothetical protein